MQISTRLDCDLVAVEAADELTLLVEVNAPTPASTVTRPAATLQIVLDRSGSMAGERLDGAKTAILSLIDRLDPTDNLGVIAFDDAVQVVVPAGPLTDKALAKHAVASIESGGMTDLSAGYIRGLQEARRVAGAAGATVLLISDGHANEGIVDPDVLGKVAGEAATDKVTTSTLGFGLGYDEVLLAALAAGGRGNELFAEEADTATALIGGEVEGLLTQVAQACSLRVTLTPDVQAVTLLNDLPCVGLADGIMIELGSFYAAECRRLVLRLAIPGIAGLGLAEVATLQFTHVSLPDLVQHTATLPVNVNVVPGDEAAGRIQDPTVVSEALFQQTQREKKDASKLLSEGRVEDASAILRGSALNLQQASLAMPSALAAELLNEAAVMSSLADESTYDVARAAKSASYDNSRKSRQRGRQSTGGAFVLRWADGDPDGVLVLEEWELVRLIRVAPEAARLRNTREVVSAAVAADIARQVIEPDAHITFFSGAAVHGGVSVERA
jgi:Ca-activated chloride channel family protein